MNWGDAISIIAIICTVLVVAVLFLTIWDRATSEPDLSWLDRIEQLPPVDRADWVGLCHRRDTHRMADTTAGHTWFVGADRRRLG